MVNGEDISAKLETKDYGVYSTDITIDGDTEVFTVFEPAEEIKVTSGGMNNTNLRLK